VSELGNYWQIPDARLDGVWFVEITSVNMRDLEDARPGQIVRCRQLPAVQYVPPADVYYDHIAGMISDTA
jgi:uncharacterized protein (DUF427 family)